MDRHLKAAVLSLLAIIAILLCITCSRAPTAGTATETENVAAMLYNPGGSPAAHAKVRFYPVNYNPATGGLAKTLAAAPDSTTTDARGNYTAKLDTGTYNILASGDSGVVYRDSITVARDSTIHPPADTLKTPGGIRGRVRLQPGADARTVFILFLGTNTFGTPDDSTGKFTITNMAQGTYKVRILTTLDAYVPKDTVLSVTAGMVDSLAHDIVLQYTGVPGPTGLTVSYDTLRQTVILAWTGADTSLIAGYNVYRTIVGQNFSLITQTPLPDTVTTYRDSTVSVGTTYAYMVVSLRAGQESPKVAIPGDTMKVLSSSLVTTTFTWNLNNTISDTASINDTIKACITYANPTSKVVKIVWYVDSSNSPVVKQKSDSSFTGKDTLLYSWKQEGNKKIFVKATDEAGTVWTDSTIVAIVQDVPVIAFLSADTIVNHGGTVRCSVYVQQKFGTMTVEIDTANSGNYKSLGSLGLSGGESYSLSTGNACAWDSVKVRILDSKGNVAVKEFWVRIKPRPLTISSIDSTVTTITVHYSQSQETDFAQYRIYRNTTSAVDTNSELWATITTIGSVSYTTPSPSYAWNPKYYRVYQKDSEGVLSSGSNVVYGCIINSPPTTPVITYPASDGDSIWPIDMLRWHPSIDPNGNGVRYRVFVNYNNTGYSQFATALTDTFLQLTGGDSLLSLKLKVITYDTLGDSSAWSTERTALVSMRPTTDIDGNVYQTVRIGTQIWMVENLKTTRHNDGTPIPLVADGTAWDNLTTPGYCWCNNDSAAYKSTYGALYNWYSVNTGKLAPTGWHVPTDSEWSVLTTYLGGERVAGGKLKTTSCGGTNDYGFSALLGGGNEGGSGFIWFGFLGCWWSSTATPFEQAYMWNMYSYQTNISQDNMSLNFGCSVRCVRDP
jgi:uncharacterized protein (TIGR02145 family)